MGILLNTFLISKVNIIKGFVLYIVLSMTSFLMNFILPISIAELMRHCTSELWEFFGLILLLFLLPFGALIMTRGAIMTRVFTIGSKDIKAWGNTYDYIIMIIFIGYLIIRIIVDISGSPSSRGGLDITLFFIVSFSLIGIVLKPTVIAFDYYSRLALKITLTAIMLIISIALINVLFFNDSISKYRLPNTKASSLNMKNLKNEKNTINVGTANIRSGPSTQYQILTVIKKGDQFTILSSKNGWSKIYFNGKEGYISNKLIQKVKN